MEQNTIVNKITQVCMLPKSEIFLPITGGGVSFIAYIDQWAPLVTLLSAGVGIVLGILSYVGKRKLRILQQRREEIQLRIMEEQLKEKK